MTTKQYVFVVAIFVLSVLASFYSGYFLKDLLIKANVGTDTSQSNLKPYFSDEIILISKNKPHYTLIAYSSRSSKKNLLFSQTQRVFFFDGNRWQKKFFNTDSKESEIAKTPIIPSWNIEVDPTLVLKERVGGEIQIDSNKIGFDVPEIDNELGIRSQEDYTIFRSEATGKLIVNGKEYESYVLYSRTYSYSVSIDLVRITDPLGINTDWVAFWDNEGNFYNVDKTSVDDNYKGVYKSHSIAVLKDNLGRVQKSFSLAIKKKSTTGYIVDITDGINRSIDVNILNSIVGNSDVFFINNT